MHSSNNPVFCRKFEKKYNLFFIYMFCSTCTNIPYSHRQCYTLHLCCILQALSNSNAVVGTTKMILVFSSINSCFAKWGSGIYFHCRNYDCNKMSNVLIAAVSIYAIFNLWTQPRYNALRLIQCSTRAHDINNWTRTEIFTLANLRF